MYPLSLPQKQTQSTELAMYALLAVLSLLVVVSSGINPVAFESLEVWRVLNLGEAFVYTNDLFDALDELIYLVIGFAMFKMVVNFVLRTVTSFSF